MLGPSKWITYRGVFDLGCSAKIYRFDILPVPIDQLWLCGLDFRYAGFDDRSGRPNGSRFNLFSAVFNFRDEVLDPQPNKYADSRIEYRITKKRREKM
ncbi:hypothetical protein BDV35DRAFT_385224 [Aspergillus flavus]|uniref:Uncharacterized protein n=1 Tax=Aspergillus flavus TaxID=5059 RepID=A0A5N6GIW1_ASPFL|nr:hypothetical protein BDV35DRAFT_385224 [Aspergillus flavus]